MYDIWWRVITETSVRCSGASLQCCDAVRGREAAAVRRREPCIRVVTRISCLAWIFLRIRLELKEQGLLECCRSAPALSHLDVGGQSDLSWWKLEAQSSMALSVNPCRLVLHEQGGVAKNRWLESWTSTGGWKTIICLHLWNVSKWGMIDSSVCLTTPKRLVTLEGSSCWRRGRSGLYALLYLV